LFRLLKGFGSVYTLTILMYLQQKGMLSMHW